MRTSSALRKASHIQDESSGRVAPERDTDMVTGASSGLGSSMEALQAGARRREAEYISKKRARIADTPQGSAVGEQRVSPSILHQSIQPGQ